MKTTSLKNKFFAVLVILLGLAVVAASFFFTVAGLLGSGWGWTFGIMGTVAFFTGFELGGWGDAVDAALDSRGSSSRRVSGTSEPLYFPTSYDSVRRGDGYNVPGYVRSVDDDGF